MTTTLGLPEENCGALGDFDMPHALRGLAGMGQASCSLMGTSVIATRQSDLKVQAAQRYRRNMVTTRLIALLGSAIILLATLTTDLSAQDREVPYWATLRFDEVRMRVGPSQEYPIEWVYKRKGLPVRVVRMREGWRLVQDHEGTQGWVASSQLNPKLGAMVIGDGLVDLRAGPDASSDLRWRAEPGVVADLLSCRESFCEIDVAGRSGWVPESRLWGVGDGEPSPTPEVVPEQ